MELFTIHPKLMRNLLEITPWAASGQTDMGDPASLIFRPVLAEDADLIVEMHARLSEGTLFKRYHSPRVPTRQEISQICQLTGENGRTLVAATGGRKAAVVGLAYYILSEVNTAELALLVEDRYQGQGIGKRLLRQLTELAIAQGICFFDALVLPANMPMLYLLEQTGTVVHNRLGYGTREIRIQLTAINEWDPVWERPFAEEPVHHKGRGLRSLAKSRG